MSEEKLKALQEAVEYLLACELKQSRASLSLYESFTEQELPSRDFHYDRVNKLENLLTTLKYTR